MLQQLVSKACSLNSFVFFSKLMEGTQTGHPGPSVVSHVTMELNSVIDHAPIHLL